jgi:hypothetical protein
LEFAVPLRNRYLAVYEIIRVNSVAFAGYVAEILKARKIKETVNKVNVIGATET